MKTGTFTDQLGRTITVSMPPQRIISIVPSQTELLADLGLENEVAGITKFCIHPESWFRSKTRVGGTKQLDFEKIDALQPDLIIANKEENEREQIVALMEKYPVWISDIKTLDQSCDMMRKVGGLTGRSAEAEKIASEVEKRFRELQPGAPKRVAYFIWKNPWMVAAGDTFIDHMLNRCGWKNVFGETPGRYPEVTLNDLKIADPEIILLSSEPYPFKEKHIAELQEICPAAKILLVDGELFSWYGSRLLHSPAYFSSVAADVSI